MLKRMWNDESGQGMVEYGLILALISVVAVTAVSTVGGNVKDKFDKIGTELGKPAGTP